MRTKEYSGVVTVRDIPITCGDRDPRRGRCCHFVLCSFEISLVERAASVSRNTRCARFAGADATFVDNPNGGGPALKGEELRGGAVWQ